MDVEPWRTVTDPLLFASGVAIFVAALIAFVAVRFTAERKR